MGDITVKAVFFDIDDTLVDHSTAMRKATVALHSSTALGIGLEEFLLSWKGAHARHYPRFLRGEVTYAESSRARVRDVMGAGVSAYEADAIFSRYLADYEQGWTLFADVIPCLDALRDVWLGVISNGPSEEQRRKLTKLGIADRFRYVCVSEDIGVAKPDARIFELACTQVGLRGSDALYVGDQYELDACAARAASLKSVWLNRRGIVRLDCDVLSVSSLDALPEIIGA